MQHPSFARSGASRPFGTLRSNLLGLAVGVLAAAALSAEAGAQAGVVGGIVVSTGGAPISAAQVRVDGTERVVVTDAGGRFRIAGLTGDAVTLDVRRIGYRPARVRSRLGETNLRITLAEQSVSLAEVVVTGTAGGQQRREIGNAVSTVNAAEVTEIARIDNVQSLLTGRVPGVFVNSAGGNPGGGARIRIRGASSMFLTNEPLIYVDGVRINSQFNSGPLNQAFGSAAISRINDINPDDIQSIEVIKGPAAATLYGTEASNGVIQIITKKGSIGAPSWNMGFRTGSNYLPGSMIDKWPINYATFNRGGGVIDTLSIDARELIRRENVFKRGPIREFDISATGGASLFTYFANLGLEDTQGIEPTSNVERYSGRVNVNITPSEVFNIGVNVGYVNGYIQLPCEGGCGGRTLATMWANPANAVPLAGGAPNPRKGFHTGLPHMYDELSQYWQDVNRFTGGLQLNHSPFSWLRHRLSAGTDRTTEADNFLAVRTEDSLSRVIFGTGAQGSRAITNRQVNYYTLDYSASAVWDPTQSIRSTTSLGAQYYRNSLVWQSASGSIFPTVGLTALSATTTSRVMSGDKEEDATLGFFVQEQVGFRDRLFLTAAVRADDNSAFGQNFDRVYYPKFSASWVVSEEPFWGFGFVDALKLRAAYGEAGKQPITFSALQTYGASTGPGDVATVTPLFLGNADLGPERSKEVELGFDLGALGDRIGAEVTWYRKRTVDAILDRRIAPSLGLPGTQPFNAGSVKNWGTELLLRGTPLQWSPVRVDLSLSIATNDSRIESLGEGMGDFVSFGTFLQHRVGYPIGSYFDQRMISTVILPNGQHDRANTLCDNGAGGTMPCAGADLIYNTADDAPAVFLGRTLPKREGAFSTTITLWDRLRVYGLLDFKSGFHKLDGNIRARCTAFSRCLENWYPTQGDPLTVAGIQSGGQLVSYYINKSDFTRLRELSLSYTLPGIHAGPARFERAVITLAGRNLRLWTDYTGLDPEAFFMGGARGGNFGQWEQNAAPQLAQWVLGVNLGW
jgi:TonB-dependent SusC/RagA subfamily outer membrane receptor